MFDKFIDSSKTAKNDHDKEQWLDRSFIKATSISDFTVLLGQYLELKTRLYPAKPDAFFGAHYDQLMQKIHRVSSLIEMYSHLPSRCGITYSC